MKSQCYLSPMIEEAIWRDLEVLQKESAPLMLIGSKVYQRYTVTVAPPHFSIAKAVRNKGGTLYPVKAEGTITMHNGQTQVCFQWEMTTHGYLIAGLLVLALIFGSILAPLVLKNSDSYPMGRFTIVFFLLPPIVLPFYFFAFPYRHLNKLFLTRWKLVKNSTHKEI